MRRSSNWQVRAVVVAALAAVLAQGCGDAASTAGGGDPATLDSASDIVSDGGLTFDTAWPTDTAQPGDATTLPDAAKPDTTPDAAADTAEACSEPGGFLCPCNDNGDCTSGYCVPGADTNVCTKECIDTCPGGMGCVLISNTGGDAVYICLPQLLHLCEPCTDHKDCEGFASAGERCVPFGEGGEVGSFCGSPCAADPDCPAGYRCRTEGLSEPQCVPESGECACSGRAISLELSTTCSVTTADGTCEGERHCAAAGLSECTAGTAAAETCNGQDDDCNGTVDDVAEASCELANEFGTCTGTTTCAGGVAGCTAVAPKAEVCNTEDDDCDGETDEATCDDGVTCTDDLCADSGTCKHPVSAGSCLIAGECVAEGATNPTNPCLTCQPTVSPATWSPADGAACDDGDACTKTDTCAAGTCSGAAYTCDDGLTCTVDACDGEGGCSVTVAQGACLIEGTCWTAGATKPGGGCLLCAPSTSTSTWTLSEGKACDDGDPCTLSDTCTGGVCAGVPLVCTALNDQCNAGVCIGGACAKAPVAGGCDDGNSCTFNDICVSGVCAGTALDCSALDSSCEQGVCVNGQCTTKDIKGPCNDGNACTDNDQCFDGECLGVAKDCTALTDACNIGLCSGGSCFKQPKPGSCNDGDSCTVSDQCSAGVCKGVAMNCSGLSDQCNQGICVSGQCAKSPLNNNCNDGNACTQNDKCSGGQCSGTALDCSYLTNQCNTGVCSNGSCKAQAKTGSCNDNNACTTSDTCGGGTCSGTPVKDGYEPNDSYVGKAITNTSDCDSTGAYSIPATLYPEGDKDWFYFKVSDNTGCDVEPKVELVVPSGVDYDLCVYFECNNGDDVDLSCTEGSKVGGPKAGTSGCCSTKTGSQSESVRLSPKCSWLGTGDESGYVDIEIKKKSGAATCSPYTLKWGDS